MKLDEEFANELRNGQTIKSRLKWFRYAQLNIFPNLHFIAIRE